MRRRLALATVLLAVSLAGCGASGTAEPAQIAPASSLVYGEATLKPEGDQKGAVDALMRKFPSGGQGGVAALFDQGFRKSKSGLSYNKDIKPWLGDTAAFFGAGVGKKGQLSAGAALIATTDEQAAMDAVEKAAKGKARDATYQDVEYKRLERGSAAGIVEGNLVIGTERGFKVAVDATDGDKGTPLGDSEAYTKALDGAPEDRLAFMYVNGPRFADATRGTLGGAAAAPLARLLKEPYIVTADADPDAIEISSTLPPSLSRTFLPIFGQGSDIIESLPGDAWGALGQPELGKTLDSYIDLFAASVGGRGVIEQQVRQATGLDVQRDITGWMGDFGAFVRGAKTAVLNGALVIETSDEAASQRALRVLQRQLTGNSGDARVGRLTAPGGGDGFTVTDRSAPKPFHFFVRDDRVVVAYGDEAAADAVKADEPLSDAPGFDSAAGSLGDGYEVSTYVDVKPIVALAEASGAASDADWREAKPYLEPIGAIVGGTKEEGGKLLSKVRVTVP